MARHTESQQMLAIAERMTKPKGAKDELKQLQAQIASDQKEMTVLLQQRFQQAQKEEARRRDSLASLISEALQPPADPSQPSVPTFANTTIAANPVFDASKKVDTACRKLVSEYNGLEAMIADMVGNQQNQVSGQWVQDVAEAERQLRLGHKVAMRNVKKVLGAHNGRGTADSEDMEVDTTTTQDLNYELLQGLKYAERGVKRMVKGLPKDD